MPHQIDAVRDEVSDLCESYGVERLELFGSLATDAFDQQESDLDFIVRFTEHVRKASGYAKQYLDFAEALEELFGREVDLVTERSIQNPYFCRSLDASRQVIYDRSGEEAPL